MRNPVLKRAYENLRPQDYVLFVDETYNAPGEGLDHTFYTVCGVLIEHRHLADTRYSLSEIVGTSYWHTTDQLRTSKGRETTVELLKFCSEVDDLYFLAHRTPLIDGTDMEEARQICLRALFSYIGEEHKITRLIVMEKRQDNTHDDADRSLVKRLRGDGVVSRHVRVLLVSPRDERLLWLADLIAMAYRRQITHSDETARYFEKYVRNSAIVLQT